MKREREREKGEVERRKWRKERDTKRGRLRKK